MSKDFLLLTLVFEKCCNPQVATCVGRKIEASRTDGTHPDLISEFYTRFKEVLSRFNIPQQNIWNTDEHGVALGVCPNSLIIEFLKKTDIR